MLGKELLDNAAGKLCKSLIPIKHDYYLGSGKRIAVCTLSSIDLLEEIGKSMDVMNRILIVGRLLSENKGIDTILRFILCHPKLNLMIICGREVKGHQAGQALLSLYKNGIDNDGRIIGAKAPYPLLRSSQKDIEVFRKQINKISDLTEIDDIEKIKNLVLCCSH
jgi:tetrahydromethanopterin S-methyltransferase subunit A